MHFSELLEHPDAVRTLLATRLLAALGTPIAIDDAQRRRRKLMTDFAAKRHFVTLIVAVGAVYQGAPMRRCDLCKPLHFGIFTLGFGTYRTEGVTVEDFR